MRTSLKALTASATAALLVAGLAACSSSSEPSSTATPGAAACQNVKSGSTSKSVTVAGDFKASIGAVVYTDKIDDTKSGSLRLENITLTGPGGTALKIDDANPLTVDVVTTKIGTADTQQLALGLPGMTGDVSVGAIKVGDTSAASIGSLTVSNLNMAGSQVRIWGH